LRSVAFVERDKRFLLDDIEQAAEDAAVLVVRLVGLQQDLHAIERSDRCLRAHARNACNLKGKSAI
jgi:hypothetical protein